MQLFTAFLRLVNSNGGYLTPKLYRVMKLTAILLLTACLQLAARTEGQTITISVKDAPAKQVFRQIHKQTGLNILVKESLLDDIGRVTLDVRNASVEEVLNLCLKGKLLDYTIDGGAIVIVQKQPVNLQTETDLLPPPLDVSGIVKDEKNAPVAGASVAIKGTNKGTTTDANGYFELKNLKDDDVLVISGTNIETVEVRVGGKTLLSITAKIKVSAIDEVQIRGYGTTTKRLSTGTIATVKGDEIKDRPVGNIMLALQGKLAGVAITNSSAGVGSASNITIRGINSITSGTNPLIVVDGVIMNEQTSSLMFRSLNFNTPAGANTYTNGLSTLNYINPSDIESVDVLKDADATGIYGSRGTNGVILITTKKAALGKTRTTINASTGWKSPTVITERMNTQQYLQMRKDAFATGNMASATSIINPITPTTANAPDLLTWSQTDYTNYPKMDIANAAPNYNVSADMSGGTKALNFIASAGYYKMYDDYMYRPYQERMTSRLQLNHTSLDNKFNLRIGTNVSMENQRFAVTNLLTSTIPASENAPNFPLYKSDGSLNLGAPYTTGFLSGYNPLVTAPISAKSKTNNVLLNADMSYTIIKGLTAKLQASYNSQANAYHLLFPSTAVNAQDTRNTAPFGQHTTNKFTSVNLEPQLSYTHSISKLNFTTLAGGTYLDKKIEGAYLQVNNPGSDDLLYSYSAGQPTTTFSNNTEVKFQSLFGRLTADWDKKYVINGNFRRDGSSRFGYNNRFANFASAGAAWIFSSESFVKNNLPFLSYGKLRGSYGTTGNDNIADYQYLGLLTTPPTYLSGAYPGFAYSGPLQISNYPNPDVKWETTTKKDISLELGFLKNRILFTATRYSSTTTNLLLTLPLAGQSGFTSYAGNFPGVVQNRGWEFELTTQNLAPNAPVKWTTKLNVSANKNLLKSFPNLSSNSSYSRYYQVGRALPSLKGVGLFAEMPFQFTGVDPATGLPQFKDVNKDGAVNSADQINNAAWIGSSAPTLWGGLTNSISYKGFSLDIFLQFSNGIFSKAGFGSNAPIGSLNNPIADVAGNYWMKPGDNTKYPRLYTGATGNSTYTLPLSSYYTYSTAFLYKGYYVRLKNLQLNYALPKKLLSRMKMNNVMLYVSGENLAVYTPVKLYKDPEIMITAGSSNSLLRTVTTGIRFEF